MVRMAGRGSVLRARDGGERRVTPLELFFDLVYVYAITQLSHLLLDHPSVGGALQTLFLLLVVWWAWVYTTWFTNWFDPEAPPVRLMLVAMTYRRILCWFAASGVLWVTGGLLEGGARYALWMLALAVDYAGPVAHYRTPGLGRSRTAEWTIEGGHFAERCQLFVIIALGESILVTGTTFGGVETSAATVAAFAVAFVGSAALWWTYFARSARDASETIARSEDPGRMARSAYTYFHLPIIAGIIAVAASDELTVAHPGDPGTFASVSLTLGGTALFVAGHGFFVWTISGRIPWSRLAVVVALAALAPLGFAVPTLALTVTAALVVVSLATWDSATCLGRTRCRETGP